MTQQDYRRTQILAKAEGPRGRTTHRAAPSCLREAAAQPAASVCLARGVEDWAKAGCRQAAAPWWLEMGEG